MSNNMNLLILSVGTKCKIVGYFKAGNGFSKVVTTDCGTYVPAAYISDVHYTVPPMKSSDYLPKIMEICKKENIGVILPLHEDELELMAKHKAAFEAEHILVVISDIDVVQTCRDKYALYKKLIQNGIPCVDTYEFEADKELISKLPFPLLIKERNGAGSVGMHKVCDKEFLNYFADKMVVVQPYIVAEEYGVDVYVDFISGRIVEIFAKKKLRMRDGETEISKAIKDDNLFALIEKIVYAMNLKGPIDMDVFKYNGNYYLLEINPRFGGGYPHAYECGVDFIRCIAENAQGKINSPRIGSYKTGNVLLKYKEVMLVDDVSLN